MTGPAVPSGLEALLAQADPSQDFPFTAYFAARERLGLLAPDAVRWILDTYAKYAHQFDDETLAAFDALNERAKT